jgi:uroporphyrin-III C-methyltransferase / precorrin-2 dehydrogenase / sirohydrochlorin ferrochelatase
MSGFVSLVGAGPGTPDLLTVRAARALAAADIVFYDALVARETLDLAPRAQRFGVGKRGGRPSMRQETINRLLVRSARRGKHVVRLKGGDPFVLGRGGEEALALTAAGIPFEVVPGVSSAVAAPALSGIPVTHRGLASAFVVVSGHAEEAWRPVLTVLSPGTVTVVVLMGLDSRGSIANALVSRGWAPSTPAAILWGAGTSASARWIGPLADLGPARTPAAAKGAAGTIVVGAVVGLAKVLGAAPSTEWDEDGPAAVAAVVEGGLHAR